MMAPGFLSITLGIIDMVWRISQSLGWSTNLKQRFFILVGGTQAFATPTAPVPQPPQLPQPAQPATNLTLHPRPMIFTRLRTLQARIQRLITWIRAEDERIWFFTTSLVCLY